MYLTIKLIHMSCAAISISGFIIRSVLKINNAELINSRWIKITPHLIDSLLLLSAGYLAVNSQQYPFADNWLSAKVIGLLLYIGFGTIVMRFGKNNRQRVFGCCMALLSFAYIIGVAITRSPMLWY